MSRSINLPFAPRIRHFAAKMDANGNASALCYKRPRAIDMRPESGQTWTRDPNGVTCAKCKRALANRGPQGGAE